jgi:hypothetical protein
MGMENPSFIDDFSNQNRGFPWISQLARFDTKGYLGSRQCRARFPFIQNMVKTGMTARGMPHSPRAKLCTSLAAV